MTNWYDVIGRVMENFFEGLMSFIFPNLIVALVIFIVGWFVSLALGKIFAGLLYRLKFNDFFAGDQWKKAMEKAEIRTNPSEFLGNIVKWIAFIVVITITVEVLEFAVFANFMNDIVNYLPNVIVAIFIFVVAVMISEVLAKMTIAATEKSDFPYSRSTGVIVKVAIWIFASFAILVQLGIAEQLLMVMFQGIIAFLVIAGGLSFGLGGQDAAKQFINRMKKMIK